MHILIINSGSSSIKFRLYSASDQTCLLSGSVQRIGDLEHSFISCDLPSSNSPPNYQNKIPIADHDEGLQLIINLLLQDHANAMTSLEAIGHRVVHGGERYRSAVVIDATVIEAIQAMISLAPLHNPANLAGIKTMQRLFPSITQVAVFDTAFFTTLPPHAYRYALPESLYLQHQVRRYGFHGTSHQYVARTAAEYLQQPLVKLRLITLHLGNGASAAAICDGICIDTSMGMTPLEGLVMGSRCGDLDPAIHFHLSRTLGMTLDEIEVLLYQQSGMKGLCGLSDMREIQQMANQGNQKARLAIEIYCYRICKYIGAYYVALGGLDALIFTAGIGENDARLRQSVCDKLSILGITLDEQKNQSRSRLTRDISSANSSISVLVIPTNEELEIARQTITILNSRTNQQPQSAE